MPLLLWIALCGLLIVAALVPARLILERPGISRRLSLDPLPRILRRKEGVPYGIAIAAGAMIASPAFPAWLW